MWLVKLKGQTADLELLANQLNAAEVKVERQDGEFYLAGTLLNGLADADQVRAYARELVQTINAAGRAGIDGYLAVDPDNVVQVDLSGRLTSTFRDTGTRFKLRKNPVPYPHAPSLTSIVLLALRDEAIEKVLRVQESRPQEWVELYKVLEVIAHDIGGMHVLEKRGWVPKADISLFRLTANHPLASGDAARHGHLGQSPPNDPMSLPDAQTLIQKIVHRWLDEKV